MGHSFALPQATKCLFVDFYPFEKEGKIYFPKGLSYEQKAELKNLIILAENRVAKFWGEKKTDPKFIFCNTQELYQKFGSHYPSPAAAIMHIGSYVVISNDGVDLDIISHELSHTELFERIGAWNRTFKIPVWFDEGLAMQVDHRSYYSLDTLKVLSNGFQSLPDVKSMDNYSQFGSGTREEVMMNYRAAKYEVAKWYSPEKLDSFIDAINEGNSFNEAY